MKLHYIKVISSLALVSFGMAGCLKDNAYEDQQIQSTRSEGQPKVIEIRVAANNARNFVSLAYNNSNNDTMVNLVPIHLATPGVASEDINVTLTFDTNLVKAYNVANHTSYIVPASSLVSIVNPNNIVTIPKGSNTGYLQVKFNPSVIIGKDWAFGLAISNVDKTGYTISGNLGSGVVAILIKNKYDGTYTVDGTLVDFINPDLNSTPDGPYPFEVELHTTGASSVKMYVRNEGYLHLIGGNSAYGEFSPQFNFDPITNKIISVTNGEASPTRNRSGEIDPSGANVYNPADKSITVKYFMNQSGSLRTTFDEHFTYVGPR